MTTKNLSKTFKGKINGQRLPPIPITNEQSIPTTTNGDLPNSILKKSKPLTEDGKVGDRILPLDDDDLETSRVIFQKSQADVLLLLDTYPPRTWNVPKCLKPSYDNMLHQGRAPNPIFETLFSSDNQHGDLIDAFPSPLSDRLPSSRYCRRSVSSSCSRRSSILFQRHTGIPVDTLQLRREETFDTLCESLPETLRPAYTPLPPIPIDPTSNLTKSLIVSTTDLPPISTDPPSNLTKSLIVSTTDVPTEPISNLKKSLIIPSTDLLPSISPPLITAEETPAIQEKKEEFTRRLLSKSLHRESNILPIDKPMNSPTIVHKTPIVKPVIAPRVQKPIVDNRRVNSVERHLPVAPIRNKLSTAASTTSINNTNHQRLGKLPLDIFQPHSKSTTTINVTNKKPIIINNKTKISTKLNIPKVKVNSTLPDEEIIQSNNDVIPPPPPPPIFSSTETAQVTNTDKSEELPSPIVNVEPVSSQTEQLKLDIPAEPKRYPSSRCSSRYSHRSSHPVPKPLTLQGEKIVDADYPQTATRSISSAMVCRQRRESLKGQPLIMELFEDSMMETQALIVKAEPIPPTKSVAMKLKKQRPTFLKNAKSKNLIVTNKPKTSPTITGKIEMKCQSTNTEINEEKNINENMIVIGGTDWMMTVKPQVINDEESALSQLFEPSTVDDEDIPFCVSPTDHLAISQTTLMTSVSDLKRRNSSESDQAIEISPVLTQIIEHSIEPTPESSLQAPKVTESSLINSGIRTIYATLQDSIRKDTSLRSLPLESNEQEVAPVKAPSTTSASSQNKTLPFEASVSVTQTSNNSDTGLSIRPALRVVNDSLNSRGSETIGSNSSQEDYSTTPLCTENDCDEIYRTARKGRQVGRGAYGIVWSYLTITGRMIAVKEIELDEGDSERVRDDYESVREEINILRGLNHPYVVKFLGISLENTRLIKIFMEYLPNGTIENLLTAFGPFHNDVLKKYTRQIVEGVAYLHSNGVVHRDIKGKNVMLDYDGNIKLIDFGCAKRLKKNQNTHSMRQILKSMKGTANWMAPEVIAETGHGKKADIWSIGCTLCEMATGKPPWSSEHNHLAVLLIIANGTKPPADLPDTCPITAQEFFRLCLTRDPSARPSAKDLLMHPFLTS